MNVYFKDKYFDSELSNHKISNPGLFSILVSENGVVKFANQSTQTDDQENFNQSIQTEQEIKLQNDFSIQCDLTTNTKQNMEIQTEPVEIREKQYNLPLIYLPTTGIIVDDSISFYKKENIKLKQQITNVTNNFNELLQLVSHLVKIDNLNPEIESIKRNLTIIVNRELRLKYAFPFININFHKLN